MSYEIILSVNGGMPHNCDGEFKVRPGHLHNCLRLPRGDVDVNKDAKPATTQSRDFYQLLRILTPRFSIYELRPAFMATAFGLLYFSTNDHIAIFYR
jgi:hypothetical protein